MSPIYDTYSIPDCNIFTVLYVTWNKNGIDIRMWHIYFFSRPQINYANLDLRQFTLCSSVSVWQWVIGFFSYYWMHRCNIIFESKVHWNLESWKVDIYKLGTCIDFTSHNACKPKNLILKCICYYWIFRSSIPRPFYFTHSGVVKRKWIGVELHVLVELYVPFFPNAIREQRNNITINTATRCLCLLVHLVKSDLSNFFL